MVKSLSELEAYPQSSFKNYLGDDSEFIESELVLGIFKSKDAYKQFVFDQADYQRELKLIEHLIME